MGNKKGPIYWEFELSGDGIPADTAFDMYSHRKN